MTMGKKEIFSDIKFKETTPEQDEYISNELTEKQKELVRELVRLELKIQSGKGTLEQFIKDHKKLLKIEKELKL